MVCNVRTCIVLFGCTCRQVFSCGHLLACSKCVEKDSAVQCVANSAFNCPTCLSRDDPTPREIRQLKAATVEHLLKYSDKCKASTTCQNKRNMLWPCGCVLFCKECTKTVKGCHICRKAFGNGSHLEIFVA
eukprot:m.17759 g.17759  ORF g.17759 m.17759 type:complete len:131 (+) comp3533_c0_seq2:77-469(+)